MKINHTDIPAIFAQFLDSNVAPKAGDLQKGIAYGIAFVLNFRLNFFMETYGPYLKMAGILGDDGMLDMDVAHNMAKFILEKTGRLNLLGYFVDSSDVETIYQIAKGYAR